MSGRQPCEDASEIEAKAAMIICERRLEYPIPPWCLFSHPLSRAKTVYLLGPGVGQNIQIAVDSKTHFAIVYPPLE